MWKTVSDFHQNLILPQPIRWLLRLEFGERGGASPQNSRRPAQEKAWCAGFSFAVDSGGEGPGYDEATSSEFRCRCSA